MNREIKFRAWDKLTSTMIGDGFHLFGEFMMFRMVETYVIEHPMEGKVNSGLEYELWRYENIVAMQFTGLKDHKGNDIYEGDILKPFIESVGPYAVTFENGSFVCYHQFGKWGLLSRAFEIDFKDCVVEVIGNVWEHPHLLTTNTKP